MKDKVAIVRFEEDYRDAVEKGFRLIGDVGFGPGSLIAIKPNLCSLSPCEGVTTDVRVVESVIQHFLDIEPDFRFCIVESSTSFVDATQAFERLGYQELTKKYPVKLINLNSSPKVTMELNGKRIYSLKIPVVLTECNHFISIAKLKTHIFERFSGAIKNQFGCLPTLFKIKFHPFLSEILFDINSIFLPDLCIIDGITALEGLGPTDGVPKEMNLLIFGRNPVLTDLVASKIMRLEWSKIPHLKYFIEHSHERFGFEGIEIVGERLPDVASTFSFVPSKAFFIMRLGLRLAKVAAYFGNFGQLVFTFGNASAATDMSIIGRKISRFELMKEFHKWVFKLNV